MPLQFSSKSRRFRVLTRFAVALLTTSVCVSSYSGEAVGAETSTVPASIQTLITNLIGDYRRVLSLQNYASTATLNVQQRQEVLRSGEYLFVEDQRVAASILERLLAHDGNATQTDLDGFIAALNNPPLNDADLFAVRGILTEVAKKARLTPVQSKQIRTALMNLAHAHQKYGDEFAGAFDAKLMVKQPRPAWTAYLAQVEQQYPAASVLEQMRAAIPSPAQQTTPSTKSDEVVALARQNEWQGQQMAKGTVLLTFDDGPHPVYTREILAILAHYRIKAIFFQLGQNLGTVIDGHAELTHNEDIEKEILAAGHAIGNHSFTHPFLPKLDQLQVEQEIDKTQALLNLVIPQDAARTHMFRAPYGARNSMILGEVGERGLRSVLWNIDSLDWSDPIPESIVHRILQELDHAGHGIILMHDIHPKTVIALPMLLDELIKRGYTFMQWDGTRLIPTEGTLTQAESTLTKNDHSN